MKIKDYNLDRVKTLLILTLLLLLSLLTYQIISEVKLASDDVLAQANLRSISDALENYQKSHGIYPRRIDQVITEEYPYKLEAYFQGVHHGFRYSYEISEKHYAIYANPVAEDSESRMIYKIQNGGELSSENPF